ncbi:hypothetical protein GCM10010448_66190 [Streptomyces glomeratus]|uniref:Secreted protein n=1 Tax=Streptomyces glomeratus TaxID=284452 RepID=A0ABP6M6P0_9ACTN
MYIRGAGGHRLALLRCLASAAFPPAQASLHLAEGSLDVRSEVPTAAARRSSTSSATASGTLSGAVRVKGHRAVATRNEKLAVRCEATILVAVLNEWLGPDFSPIARGGRHR